MATIDFRVILDDETQRGYRQVQQRLQGLENSVTQFNRTSTQQARDHTTFLNTQYRQRARQYQQQQRDRVQAAERARREEVRAAERAQREEERLRRYHQQLVIRSRREEERAAERSARAQARALQRVTRSYDRFFARIGRGFREVSLFYGGFGIAGLSRGVGDILRTGIQFDQIQRGLQAITGSAIEANRQMELLRQAAQAPGVEFLQAARGLQQLQSLNVGAERSIELITGIGNEIAIVGGSGDDLQGVVRAFTQIIGRGEVLQEELNQINERLPGFRAVLQEAFGAVSAEGIRSAIRDTDDFLDRIIATLNARPAAEADSISNVISNFRNAVAELSAQLAQLALPRLTEQIQTVTNLIQQNSESIVQSVSGIADRILNVIDAVLGNLGRFIEGIKLAGYAVAFFAVSNLSRQLSAGLANISEALSSSTSSIAQFGASVSNLSSIGYRIVGVLGGVIGLGAAAAAAFQFLPIIIQGFSNTRNAVDELNASLKITVDVLSRINNISESTSGFNRGQIGQNITQLRQDQQDAINQVAELEQLLTTEQGAIRVPEAEQRYARAVGVSRFAHQRSLAVLRQRVATDEQLLELARQKILSSQQERNQLSIFSIRNRERIEEVDTEIQAYQNLIDVYELAEESISRLQDAYIDLTFSTQEAQAAAAAGAFDPNIDLQDPVDIEVLRVGFNNFQQEVFSGARAIRRELDDAFVPLQSQEFLVLDALNNIVPPEELRQPIDFDAVKRGIQALPSPLLVNPTVENAAIDEVADHFVDTSERTASQIAASNLLDTLLRDIGTGPDVEIQPISDRELADAFDPLLDMRDRLREQYDRMAQDAQAFRNRITSIIRGVGSAFGTALTDIASIPANLIDIRRNTAQEIENINQDLAAEIERIENDRELNAIQRAERIADAENRSAQARIETEREASDARSNAYRDWARNAISSIAEVIAQEIQLAVVRATIQQIGPSITGALTGAGIGLFPQVGIGLAAVAGLQLAASSFHNPVLDMAAQESGFRNAQRLRQNPISYGEQSGRDLVANYDVGFQRGVQQDATGSTTTEAPPTDNVVQIIIDAPIVMDNTEVARLSYSEIIRLQDQNILPQRRI